MKINRICFNFLGKCNAGCGFCYSPFMPEKIDFNSCINVLSRLSQFFPDIITFGGGDPFAIEFFPDLVEYTKNKRIRVDVDTNGISLKPTHYSFLEKNIDIISLPLESSSPSIHDKMRGKNHFSTVKHHLENLQQIKIKIKINTVATSINIGNINELVEFLDGFKIDIWSIYQFWRISQTTSETFERNIETNDFLYFCSSLNASASSFKIEISPVIKRFNSYFFVSHSGIVYTIDPNNKNRYLFLGSVFDDRTITTWKSLCDFSIRKSIMYRYFDN